MLDDLVRKAFVDLKQREGQLTDAELDDFWSTLQTVEIPFLIGEWSGDEFQTGHVGNGGMARIGFFGKTFVSATDTKPLICLDADGQKFSNVEHCKGEASLWMEEFRGQVTATMVYDGVAIHDHFAKVDDDTVVGIMNGKQALDNGRHLYFWLERLPVS